ncbi:hypothetical protein ACCO45_013750 [Purpureocillium lilacinum]|uniref:Uncharacterized protein n=1 Tax=Purpureocillium lilacinum TaxID=33203 RepID=A0ACC4D7H4_PURLI
MGLPLGKGEGGARLDWKPSCPASNLYGNDEPLDVVCGRGTLDLRRIISVACASSDIRSRRKAMGSKVQATAAVSIDYGTDSCSCLLEEAQSWRGNGPCGHGKPSIGPRMAGRHAYRDPSESRSRSNADRLS